MSNNYFAKEIKDRLYSCMKDKGITSSDLCRALNIAYPDLKATLEGKSPLYNKWQKKIADTLGVDKEYLFKELHEPKLTEEEIRLDERAKTLDEIIQWINNDIEAHTENIAGRVIKSAPNCKMIMNHLRQMKDSIGQTKEKSDYENDFEVDC